MLKSEEKYSLIEICPVRNVVARFGNKWSLLVILILSEQEVVRFNELCRLTPLGQSLVPLIAQLTAWAQANMPAILRHRRASAS